MPLAIVHHPFFDADLPAGHRFPMGIARTRAGEMFVTDNQGNYNPFNELNHVVPGKRFGFINKIDRTPEFKPPLTPPARSWTCSDASRRWAASRDGKAALVVGINEIGLKLEGLFEVGDSAFVLV